MAVFTWVGALILICGGCGLLTFILMEFGMGRDLAHIYGGMALGFCLSKFFRAREGR